MTKKIVKQFGGACFCLLRLIDHNHCEAVIYIRTWQVKAWHIYECQHFRSSGPAIAWARSIEPTIQIVKVQHYEC